MWVLRKKFGEMPITKINLNRNLNLQFEASLLVIDDWSVVVNIELLLSEFNKLDICVDFRFDWGEVDVGDEGAFVFITFELGDVDSTFDNWFLGFIWILSSDFKESAVEFCCCEFKVDK